MYHNYCEFAGYVGKDPETKVYDKKDGEGKGYITTFSLAIDEGFGSEGKQRGCRASALIKKRSTSQNTLARVQTSLLSAVFTLKATRTETERKSREI